MEIDGTLQPPPGYIHKTSLTFNLLVSCRVLELNTGIIPEQLNEAKTEEEEWGEMVVGDPVSRIPPLLPYNVHFPFRRGDLHLHSGVGGSLSSVLLDLQVDFYHIIYCKGKYMYVSMKLQAIWEDAIQRELGIDLVDLHQYRAVLVIPALYK